MYNTKDNGKMANHMETEKCFIKIVHIIMDNFQKEWRMERDSTMIFKRKNSIMSTMRMEV